MAYNRWLSASLIPHSIDLVHHGVKGQKWGKRNGPPYPLDSSKSTGSRLKPGVNKERPSGSPQIDSGRYSRGHRAAKQSPKSAKPFAKERNYETDDWTRDGSGRESIKEFNRNADRNIATARKSALKEARRVFEAYGQNDSEFKKASTMSDNELAERIGLKYVGGHSHGTVSLTFGDRNGDFLGHLITVEFDTAKKRVVRTSVDG